MSIIVYWLIYKFTPATFIPVYNHDRAASMRVLFFCVYCCMKYPWEEYYSFYKQIKQREAAPLAVAALGVSKE